MNRIAPIAGALLAAAMLIALLITAAPATASPPGASVVLDQPDGFTDPFTGAGGDSETTLSRAVSADGRYVAFVSSSDGLSAADDDGRVNVFRKDRVTGAVALVSVAPDGRGANASSFDPQISADGDRVAFLSTATNLDPAAADGGNHLYVRDVAANATIVASRATGGGGTAVDVAGGAISGDGRVVAFTTTAGLDPQDANNKYDIYARRLATDETLLVSRRDGAAGAPGGASAYEPSVNGDGSQIAFTSDGPLAIADANGLPDVYRRTLTTGTTDLVSGNDADGKAGNGASDQPAIAASGDAVAFVSRASDLDSQVFDDTSRRADVFVAIGRDQRQLSPVPSGNLTRGSFHPSIAGSPGAVSVAFQTTFAAEPGTQIAVHTLATGQVEVASVDEAGQWGRADSWGPSLAANGRVAVFSTLAGLGAGSGGDYSDAVARDLVADRTDLVSAPATGPLAEDLSRVNVRQGGGQLSPDARYATFSADHDGLGVADRSTHVFLRDARTGRTVLVDRADGPAGAVSAEADGASTSADGRIVAFTTETRLVAGDLNDDLDVYVRDTVANTTRLVSRTPTGGSGDDDSAAPVVSADGRRVAFETYATDLGAGDVDGDVDVHVLDLVTGDLLLASRAAAPANGGAFQPTLSADGSRVAFASVATNLDPADTDVSADVFVRDLTPAGTTRLASRRTDGGKGAAASSRPSLSADGRAVAFQSAAPLHDDADLFDDVYVRDLVAGTTTLVSRASGAAGAKANGRSELPAISADGTAVAFRSSASNLAGPQDGVYVRRLADATTMPMGLGRHAGLSADGSCLMMATRSSEIIRSSSDYERVLLRAVRDSCELPEALIEPTPGAPQPGPTGPVAQGGAPRLSALSLTRRRFRVGKARAAATSAVRRGTVVRFRLDQPAAVSLTVRQRVGRRSVARGTLRRTGRAGRNRVAFSGGVARRTLRPGRYVIVARARAAGGTSAPRRVAFRIVLAGR